MLGVLGKFFDTNEKEINKVKPVIEKINSLEKDLTKLKLSDFPKKTNEFRQRVEEGEPLTNILPEAFALVREAAKRTIGLRHFDVQLIASTALAQGKIAEQKTGEGKTLSATPALYLHSLTGKNVHLVTVNDYLARRDCGWMGPIFDLLGLKVSSIISEESFIFDPKHKNKDVRDLRLLHLKSITRKEAYEADIVYGINSEFGFDYLRDNMATDKNSLAQKGFYFAIVDEVDSVLIDEARTPHIISQPDEAPTQKYYEYAKLVDKLTSETDYKIDEKLRTAHLTEHGIEKIEKLYGISNIYEKDFDTVYHLEAALKARTLFKKEKDYIVKDGEVILVDEFTGRLMIGRRLSEGLHQAIEAKENVAIQKESKTLATVSLQNYFRMYEHLAGMTGTAVTEAEEFNKIYKLDVIVIPTHRDMIRKDLSDAIYKTGRAKYTAVAAEIEKASKRGQPVLVGTTSIDKNEIVSELLKRKGIKHEILNAKNHEREAEIISKAGEKGAVTVATNMAGRGVDIILGGEPPQNEDGTNKTGTREWEDWEKKHKEILELGGLYVIGTERHESRRIDNQLRGRSGRQGDPGLSQFFVGLDDDIMRLFGGDQISSLMTRFNMPEDVPLQHPLVSRAIEQAQIKVEGHFFDARKHEVEYDDVLNKQRQIIYANREEILQAEDKNSTKLKEEILQKIQSSIAAIVALNSEITDGKSPSEQMALEFSTIIPSDENSIKQIANQLEQIKPIEDKTSFLNDLAVNIYTSREKEFKKLGMESVMIEKYVMLTVIDNLWIDHLDAVMNFRQGVGLRAYGQKDPLVEYKNEAFTMFERLINGIDDEIVHRIYKIQVHNHPVEQSPASQPAVVDIPAGGNSNAEVSISEKVSAASRMPNLGTVRPESVLGGKKLGRNDPCWCGSGKKYKKCHYPN